MESSDQTEARRRISWDMANAGAVELGLQQRFLESREWPGYQKAFNSWKRSIWKWVDSGITHKKNPAGGNTCLKIVTYFLRRNMRVARSK